MSVCCEVSNRTCQQQDWQAWPQWKRLRPGLGVLTGAAWALLSESLQGRRAERGDSGCRQPSGAAPLQSGIFTPSSRVPSASRCPGLLLPIPVSLPAAHSGVRGSAWFSRVDHGAARGALPGPVTGCPAREGVRTVAVRGPAVRAAGRVDTTHSAAQLGVPSSSVRTQNSLEAWPFLARQLFAWSLLQRMSVSVPSPALGPQIQDSPKRA